MQNSHQTTQPQPPTQLSSSTQPTQQTNAFQQQQQQITPETLAQFTQVCNQATQLMLSYKQQSQSLKQQITSMVNIYNKNANPSEAVPVQKIIQITNVYENQMKNAQNQYMHLESELKKEEQERDSMVGEIMKCFEKLEKMEKIIKERKQAKENLEKKDNNQQNKPVSQVQNQAKKENQKIQQNKIQ